MSGMNNALHILDKLLNFLHRIKSRKADAYSSLLRSCGFVGKRRTVESCAHGNIPLRQLLGNGLTIHALDIKGKHTALPMKIFCAIQLHLVYLTQLLYGFSK